MAELVEQDREEEQRSRADGDAIGLHVRAAKDVTEVAREGVDQDEQHDEPARARPDADAEEARELDGAAGSHHPIFAARARKATTAAA